MTEFADVEVADASVPTGLELLKAMVAGDLPLPPIAHSIGFKLVEAEENVATFECELGIHLLNPFGVVHGGVALSLVDSAAGCAVQSRLGPGVGYASIETKVNFTRAILPSMGSIRATGRVVTLGRRIATAEAIVRSKEDEIVAHGTSTIMILNVPSTAPRQA